MNEVVILRNGISKVYRNFGFQNTTCSQINFNDMPSALAGFMA